MRQKLLFSILSLLGLPLSMMAQTITPERKTVALGEDFSKHIKTFETNKWYYITNTDKRRSGEGSIYNTKVFGNAIYPLSSNLEDENFVGNEDGLTFGYYDAELVHLPS